MEQEKRRRGRPVVARWEAIPRGVRLTLGECARIIGIKRETLRRHYIAQSGDATLPAGIEVERDGHTVLVVRLK